MSTAPVTSGRAFRVTLLLPQQAEACENVFVQVDTASGVAERRFPIINHNT